MVEENVHHLLIDFLPKVFDIDRFGYCKRFFDGSSQWGYSRYLVAGTVIQRSVFKETRHCDALFTWQYEYRDQHCDFQIDGDGFSCLCRLHRKYRIDRQRDEFGSTSTLHQTLKLDLTDIVFDGSVEALSSWIIYALLTDPRS